MSKQYPSPTCECGWQDRGYNDGEHAKGFCPECDRESCTFTMQQEVPKTKPFKTCDHSGAKIPKTPDEILRDAAQEMLSVLYQMVGYLDVDGPENLMLKEVKAVISKAEGKVSL